MQILLHVREVIKIKKANTNKQNPCGDTVPFSFKPNTHEVAAFFICYLKLLLAWRINTVFFWLKNIDIV